jgi:hypothetical protein
MEYSILVEGGSIVLDEKVDCRKIIDGCIYLGRLVNSKVEAKLESEPIYLKVRAYYYTNIGCLVMLRSITHDTIVEHQSALIAWQGGLVPHMEVDRFLVQSLHWSAVRIRAVDFLGGRFSDGYFEPALSLAEVFKSPEPRMPTSMSAAPTTETNIQLASGLEVEGSIFEAGPKDSVY